MDTNIRMKDKTITQPLTAVISTLVQIGNLVDKTKL